MASIVIVFAWRLERALRTPLTFDELGLKVHGRFPSLIMPLHLKPLVDFGDIQVRQTQFRLQGSDVWREFAVNDTIDFVSL